MRYRPFWSGCGRTQIGCNTPSVLIVSASSVKVSANTCRRGCLGSKSTASRGSSNGFPVASSSNALALNVSSPDKSSRCMGHLYRALRLNPHPFAQQPEGLVDLGCGLAGGRLGELPHRHPLRERFRDRRSCRDLGGGPMLTVGPE